MIRVAEADDPAALEKYRNKRDPGRTNEPFAPELTASSSSVQQPTETRAREFGAFVVQEHHASRRHFDLRLELGGVLKSWAVPRGPTLDPDERRLAVETEDHPLAYLEYEGVIPDANYGAGPMTVWDMGRVRWLEKPPAEGLAGGKLDFELSGYKLRGRFGLVLTKKEDRGQRQWILLKKRDVYAAPKTEITEQMPLSILSGLRPDELAGAPERARALASDAARRGAKKHDLSARSLVPMRAAQGEAPLESARHVYELKLDGVRIVAEKRGGEVALYYRKGRSATLAYPEIVRALKALPVERVILDGEVVAYDEQGRPNFQRLAARFAVNSALDVRRAMQSTAVSYVVFDLLALEGLSLLPVALVERKALLARLLPPRGPVRALDHLAGDGRELFAFCRTQGLEGLVAKRADAPYRPGPRASRDWIKVKCDREDDFVVVGYVRGQAARVLGALDLASYEGERLVLRGKVGSGIDEATEALLLELLGARAAKRCAAEGTLVPAPRGRTFVRPELVVSVRHEGFTRDGHLWHPVFRGLRADASPEECTAAPKPVLPLDAGESDDQIGSSDEAPKEAQVAAASERPAKSRGASAERQGVGHDVVSLTEKARGSPAAAPKSRVVISNPSKLFWPEDGYTKRDLCAYYEALAPTLLPYLRDRPVILVRYPDGIAGKSFYQWNAPRGTPSWVKTVRVRWEDRDGKEVDLFLLNDVDTLLHIANLGCIPLHILAARVGQLERCDFLTVDFDLNGQPLAHAITLARALAALLAQLGLRGFPKTSGQTGLHVLVPLGPGVQFETARALAELLGRLVTSQHPELATMERTKAKRGPRVYVDTGQTGTIRAIVAPYSVRAYPGARVSTPLTWDEVGFALDPARYTIATVPERVARHGCPMRLMLAERPALAAAIEQLAKILPRPR